MTFHSFLRGVWSLALAVSNAGPNHLLPTLITPRGFPKGSLRALANSGHVIENVPHFDKMRGSPSLTLSDQKDRQRGPYEKDSHQQATIQEETEKEARGEDVSSQLQNISALEALHMSVGDEKDQRPVWELSNKKKKKKSGKKHAKDLKKSLEIEDGVVISNEDEKESEELVRERQACVLSLLYYLEKKCLEIELFPNIDKVWSKNGELLSALPPPYVNPAEYEREVADSGREQSYLTKQERLAIKKKKEEKQAAEAKKKADLRKRVAEYKAKKEAEEKKKKEEEEAKRIADEAVKAAKMAKMAEERKIRQEKLKEYQKKKAAMQAKRAAEQKEKEEAAEKEKKERIAAFVANKKARELERKQRMAQLKQHREKLDAAKRIEDNPVKPKKLVPVLDPNDNLLSTPKHKKAATPTPPTGPKNDITSPKTVKVTSTSKAKPTDDTDDMFILDGSDDEEHEEGKEKKASKPSSPKKAVSPVKKANSPLKKANSPLKVNTKLGVQKKKKGKKTELATGRGKQPGSVGDRLRKERAARREARAGKLGGRNIAGNKLGKSGGNKSGADGNKTQETQETENTDSTDVGAGAGTLAGGADTWGDGDASEDLEDLGI